MESRNSTLLYGIVQKGLKKDVIAVIDHDLAFQEFSSLRGREKSTSAKNDQKFSKKTINLGKMTLTVVIFRIQITYFSTKIFSFLKALVDERAFIMTNWVGNQPFGLRLAENHLC